MKYTCLLYAGDGFDEEVLKNVKYMYEELEYLVAYGDVITRTNLLVLLRFSNLDLNQLKNADIDEVHIFDYVCDSTKITEIVKARPDVRIRIYVSSQLRKDELEALQKKKMLDLNAEIVKAFYPVVTKFWKGEIRHPTKFRFIHIGNYKSTYEDDLVSQEFLKLIYKLNCKVYGAGWDTNHKHLFAKKVRLNETVKMYAGSQYALGQMYPYQRGKTVSGRFWLAPLNGCVLISEGLISDFDFPGVIAYRDFRFKERTLAERKALASSAKRFWDYQYLLTRALSKTNHKHRKYSKNFFILLIKGFILQFTLIHLLVQLKARLRVFVK